MILVINICNEKLHYYEFVKPIKSILDNLHVDYFIKNYNKVNKEDLEKAKKIIICGTSLKDSNFLNNLNKFYWIKSFNGGILGICGGLQVIGLIYGGILEDYVEIGFFHEVFEEEFLGLKGDQEVYHLHSNHIDFSKLKDFKVYCENKISQSIKHTEKEIYGVLFHPEVRQKNLINEFVES
tara:strand:- start:26093 stop:26635 length:543 start_codon:yes stop_codon:yes gene_type:complete